tara:strand:- start:1003 stop:1350 length:348 start_codon:yes stop_codon:yes gene_type:complete
MSESEGQLQDYSVDQLAGAVVLVLGAVAGLLQVIWMSKCHCKVNLCYIFRCERRPPTEEEMKTLKSKINEKKQDKILKKEEEILEEQRTPRLVPEKKEIFYDEEESEKKKLKELI